MDEHLLEVKNLKVSFKVGKKKLTAVDNVTFSLDRGKVIGIVGLPVLPFAVGLYLPIHLSAGIMFGGVIRLFLENRKNVSKEVKKEQIDRGVLYTSGLIAGEGLVGVLLAIFAVIKIGKSSLADIINLSDFVNLGQIGSVIFFALLILTLFKFTIWYKDKNKAS